MQKPAVIDAIHSIINNKINSPKVDHFSAQSRLNEDLYLDSVLLMELLINLELEYGFNVPDTALKKDDFATVDSLTNFLLRDCSPQSGEAAILETASASEIQENHSTVIVTEQPLEFEDIKVHCFVSCLCGIIKSDNRVDHRPFYFGVWDSEIIIDAYHQLSYHSDSINHDFFREWYKNLYGVPVTSWYETTKPKSDNISHLLSLLKNKPSSQQVMVMLDLYRLPERENKFNQNPFPHYVILELTDNPNEFFMYDPDFRWEGTLDKDRVLHAISSPSVAGGFCFDSKNIQPSSRSSIRDYFLTCMDSTKNPLTDSVQTILQAFTQTTKHHHHLRPLSRLSDALKHLPVLAIRKYAYEHGLAYFWRDLNLNMDEFEYWCDQIESLVSTYKLIQYRAMKMALSPSIHNIDRKLLTETNQLIAQQNRTEFAIKSQLKHVFDLWENTFFPETLPSRQPDLEAS